MKNDLNRCEFIGRLGKDPEMASMQNGDAVAKISIAVGESWKDKQGQKQERTTWVQAVAFGRLAEVISQYLKKGSQVYLAGKLSVRKWQGQDGRDNYTTEIVVSDMQMLGQSNNGQAKNASNGAGYSGSGRQQQAPSQRNQQPAQRQQSGGFCDDAGDIPF